MQWRPGQAASRRGPVHPDTLQVIAIAAGFAGAGVLIGWVIASGKPIPILLALGSVAGVALLGALPLVVWTILVGVLLVSGPLAMFVPGLDKVGWLFSVLGFFLLGAVALQPAARRTGAEAAASAPSPAYVGLLVLLLAYGLMSLAWSDGSLAEGVRAAKRWFQFFGLLFVLAVVPFSQALVQRWWGFVMTVALLQLPFALYQRLVIAPAREGRPSVDALDIVVGTMEGSFWGGGSIGPMTLLLVSAIAYAAARWREGLLGPGRLAAVLLLLAAPLALGTATVVVVLLPIALAAVFGDLVRARLAQLLAGAVVAVPVIALAGWGWLAVQAEAAGEPIERRVAAIVEYNFGAKGYYGGAGLNRTTLYPYWWDRQSAADPLGFVFGHGLGASFGGVNEADPGHMDRAHRGMYIGLTAASSALWDLGVAGLALLVALPLAAARRAARLVRIARPGQDRAFCRSLLAMALMHAALLFHSTAAIAVPSQQVMFALTLGLISWRSRQAAIR